MRTRGARGAALAFAFSLISLAAFAAKPGAGTYEARVVHLRDGDSLIVSVGDDQREIRIAEIDAPERGQPWGKRAKQALARLVEGQSLRAVVIDHDRYGRDVAQVWVGEVCVGCELVRGGHAWAYRAYLRDKNLLRLEQEAREARRGLWSLSADTTVPPWEWRRGLRTASGAQPEAHGLLDTDSSGRSGFACGAKRHCKEMSSCAEALFHLQRCGLSSLDRDGDGVACEAICK